MLRALTALAAALEGGLSSGGEGGAGGRGGDLKPPPAPQAPTKAVDVPGDGDCLFSAVALAQALASTGAPPPGELAGLRARAAALRAAACDAICGTDADHVRADEPAGSLGGLPAALVVEASGARPGESGRAYVRRMRQAGEWGGEAELLALAVGTTTGGARGANGATTPLGGRAIEVWTAAGLTSLNREEVRRVADLGGPVCGLVGLSAEPMAVYGPPTTSLGVGPGPQPSLSPPPSVLPPVRVVYVAGCHYAALVPPDPPSPPPTTTLVTCYVEHPWEPAAATAWAAEATRVDSREVGARLSAPGAGEPGARPAEASRTGLDATGVAGVVAAVAGAGSSVGALCVHPCGPGGDWAPGFYGCGDEGVEGSARAATRAATAAARLCPGATRLSLGGGWTSASRWDDNATTDDPTGARAAGRAAAAALGAANPSRRGRWTAVVVEPGKSVACDAGAVLCRCLGVRPPVPPPGKRGDLPFNPHRGAVAGGTAVLDVSVFSAIPDAWGLGTTFPAVAAVLPPDPRHDRNGSLVSLACVDATCDPGGALPGTPLSVPLGWGGGGGGDDDGDSSGVGPLVALLGTGAYQRGLAGRHNGVPAPLDVWVTWGEGWLADFGVGGEGVVDLD